MRTQLDRLAAARSLDVEAGAVALLDRPHRRRLPPPRQRPDDREAGGDRRHLGSRKASAPAPTVEISSGHSRFSRVRPGRARAASPGCARWRAARRSAALVSARRPSQIPISAADHPPAGRERDEQVVAVPAGAGHGHRGEHGGRAGAGQDRGVEEVGEAHVRSPRLSAAAPRATRSRRPCPSTHHVGLARRSRTGPRRSAHRPARPLELCPRRPSARARGRRRGRSRRRPRTGRRRRRRRPGTRRSPAPLSIRTGGRTSSTLRPQWVRRPPASARAAIASIAARAASSSGAPRQWKATIGPLSSMRTRRRRSSAVSASRRSRGSAGPVLRPRGRPPARSSPARSTSAPCEPR